MWVLRGFRDVESIPRRQHEPPTAVVHMSENRSYSFLLMEGSAIHGSFVDRTFDQWALAAPDNEPPSFQHLLTGAFRRVLGQLSGESPNRDQVFRSDPRIIINIAKRKI